MRKGWNKWPVHVHVRNVEYRFGFRKRPMDWALSKHKEIERYTPLLMARTQLLSNARHFLYSFLFEIRSVHKTRSWSKENGILMRLLSLYDERWGVEWFTKKAPPPTPFWICVEMIQIKGRDKLWERGRCLRTMELKTFTISLFLSTCGPYFLCACHSKYDTAHKTRAD